MSDHETHLLRFLPLLQQVLVRVGAHRTDTGARLGLTNLQLSALKPLYKGENLTMSALAKEMFVSPPAATRVVDELVGKKMVTRFNDPGDRRVVRLKITDKGKEAFDKVHDEAHALLGRALERMDKNEREALVVGLEGFVGAFISADEEKNKSRLLSSLRGKTNEVTNVESRPQT